MTDSDSLLCELCGTPMTSESPGGSGVRYHHCAGCGRWVASNYGDDLVRAHTARTDQAAASTDTQEFDRVKERLGRWLQDLDERDPYFVLGVPPSASEETVRARFKELALKHHPDHGGDAATMRRLLQAYDQIRGGKRAATPPTSVQASAVRRAAAPRVATRRR